MCFSEPGRVLICYSVAINQDLEPNVKKKNQQNETRLCLRMDKVNQLERRYLTV